MTRICEKTNKVIEASELEANIKVARIQAQRSRHRKKAHNSDEPVRSYECEFCRGWHLTGQTKRGRGDG